MCVTNLITLYFPKKKGPDGYPRKVKVSDNGDGTFKATYTPDDLGQYKVNVKYGGKEVPHAPFNVQAVPTGKVKTSHNVNNKNRVLFYLN